MINIINVKNRDEGQIKAHDILKDNVDELSLLALSGGTTPDYLKMIVEPNDLTPGAICVVDERYGDPLHQNSNELLLMNARIKNWADDKCIETHKILKGKDFLETGEVYEKEIEDLFSRFPKKIGVMGVGENMHTAGIFPLSVAGKSPKFVEAENVDDKFPQRISLTLKALGEFSLFVIMMFGEKKRETINKILDEKINDMQKFPAIFYRKCQIPAYLITDVKL